LQIEYFTNAIRIDIEYAGTYNNRGVAYYMKGEYDRAIRDYNKAIELKPDCAEAYYNRGTVVHSPWSIVHGWVGEWVDA